MALVHRILEIYVALQPHELTTVALWTVYCHVFQRFMIAPRLALISPTHSCGKTTLLDAIGRLLPPNCRRTDNITPAAIADLVDREGGALLLDEADNLELGKNKLLLAVLNGGYRKGAHIDRKGKRFVIFAPMALAMIAGEQLPPQLRARCIQIAMQRSDGARELRRFDANNTGDFDAVRGEIRHWARNAVIDLDPDLPTRLPTRLRTVGGLDSGRR